MNYNSAAKAGGVVNDLIKCSFYEEKKTGEPR